METTTKQLEKPKETVADFLRSNRAIIESAAKGGIIKPDRILSFAINSIRNNPTLASCTKGSLLKAVLVSAQLGLIPDNILGEGYLVPFWSNKEKVYEAQFIIGYRGLIKLLFQAGFVIDVDPHVVYKNDVFEFNYGLHPTLIHKPFEEDRGEIRGFYAVIRFNNGVSKFHFMSAYEVRCHSEKFSKSKTKDGKLYGTWVDHFEAMALKTVIKQGTKYCPLSVDLVNVLSTDEKREQGLVIDIEQPEALAIGPGEVEKKLPPATGGVSGLENVLGETKTPEPVKPLTTPEPSKATEPVKTEPPTELFPHENTHPTSTETPSNVNGSAHTYMSEHDQINDYLTKNYKTPSAKQNRLRKLAVSVCQEYPEMSKHIALAGQLSDVNNIPPDLAKVMASEIREMASVSF